MSKASRRKALSMGLLVLSLLAAEALLGITVFEQDLTCPICKTHNKVLTVGSWGSYACRSEGEFDLVPCPIAYTGSLWSCRRCKFTSFISDMQVPQEKVAAIREYLRDLPSEIEVWRPEIDAGWRPKVSDQLAVAQGVYRILGRDKLFWSEFYRVSAFFSEYEGRSGRARNLRASALRVTEQLLASPARAAYRKEDLLAAGAMAAKLGDIERARKYLRAVKAARYDPPNRDSSDLASDMNELAARILKSLP